MASETPTSERPHLTGPHLWQVRWVRDLALLSSIVVVIRFLFLIQGAVIPVLIAFIFAYVLEPVVRKLEKDWGWRRPYVVAGLMLVLLSAMTALLSFLTPLLVEQVSDFAKKAPKYVQVLQDQLGIELPSAQSRVLKRLSEGDPAELAKTVAQAFGEAGHMVQTIAGVLGSTLSLAVAVILTVIVFAVFALRFDRLPSLKRFLPASHREAMWERLGQIEAVFSGFLRGQLLVAAFTTTIFSIGFALSGVPFWFVAALVGGTMSIIPYGQGVGWILAVTFKFAEAQSSGAPLSWTSILLGPTIVYAVMQALETLVVTPLVQGSSTRLHPVAVMVAVIAGGSFGGLLGVFLAIPVAATLKILLMEEIIPRMNSWADAS